MRDYIIAVLDWCKIKIFLFDKRTHVLFKEGEIWWCSIGMNVGVEIFGKGRTLTRPILIFKKFSPNSFLGIPLTSKIKEGKWYIPIISKGKSQGAILSQLRTFDSRRLVKRIETMHDNNFQKVRSAFLEFYGS